jgi:hypothetical protein
MDNSGTQRADRGRVPPDKPVRTKRAPVASANVGVRCRITGDESRSFERASALEPQIGEARAIRGWQRTDDDIYR